MEKINVYVDDIEKEKLDSTNNNINETNQENNDSNKINEQKNKKRNYFLFETYTSNNNPFNFKSIKLLDGIIFFLGAIILPFLINIIVTYSMRKSSNNIENDNQRVILELVSWGILLIVLVYLWIKYGKKFINMGGLAFFWMALIMPVACFILSMFVPAPPNTLVLPMPQVGMTQFEYLKECEKLKEKFNENISNYNGYLTLIQVLVELLGVIIIFLTTKKLWKRFIETYKDGWVFYITIIVGYASIVLFNYLFNFISISNTKLLSDNQDSLNKLLDTTWTTILLGVFTLIVAPFFEELTTRNGIFILSGNKWIGYVGSILYFAGMHVQDAGDWQDITEYLAASIILTSVFMVSNGNVGYTITLHSIVNLVSFVQLVWF